MTGREIAKSTMEAAGVSPAAINTFLYFYDQLAGGESGTVRESEITPVAGVPRLADLPLVSSDALHRTVVIKLNGGLGTSMGMDRAKSLLPVRGDLSFLDVTARQVLAARRSSGARLPLVLMNSFRTQDDTRAALAAYPELVVDGLPLDFLQNREPKLTADGLEPVRWPKDPTMEWCPPGHGDLYPALLGSGLLDSLIAAGYHYAAVSNADNLGATPDARIAAWFAASGAPFAMEVARRTPADRKGGHVVRKADGRLALRESAQVHPDDLEAAGNITLHAFFNTNNLWLDLLALRATLDANEGVLPLPLIRNEKTVDPADSRSTKVIQIESAMGAAIEVFDGAAVLEVDRSRFLPVKTTNDLVLLRSDVYADDEQHRVVAVSDPPAIDLDKDYFAKVRDLDQRMPFPLSLRRATALTVAGAWSFGSDVTVIGAAHLVDHGEPMDVPEGATLGSGETTDG